MNAIAQSILNNPQARDAEAVQKSAPAEALLDPWSGD